MTIEIFKERGEATRARRLRTVLCRFASLALFTLGLAYWVRLVGIFEGDLFRFDLMPLSWRVAAPMLAVLYPIAGVGLWMAVSWGVVLWIAAALAEGFMLFALPGDFGGDPTVFAGHVLGLAALGGLHAFARLEGRRRDTV